MIKCSEGFSVVLIFAGYVILETANLVSDLKVPQRDPSDTTVCHNKEECECFFLQAELTSVMATLSIVTSVL